MALWSVEEQSLLTVRVSDDANVTLECCFSFRSHDSGPRPVEVGVGVRAWRSGWLWDESQSHCRGNSGSCGVPVRTECRLLQHQIELVSGKCGERRQDGAGQRRRAERPVWHQKRWHPGVRVRHPANQKRVMECNIY